MTLEDLKKKSISELRELAKVLNIDLDSKAKKNDIILAIAGPEAVNADKESKNAKRTKSKTAAKATEICEDNKDSIADSEITKENAETVDINEKQGDVNASEVSNEQEVPKANDEPKLDEGKPVHGIFEQVPNEAYGFVRFDGFFTNPKDVFVTPPMIKKFGLRTGDMIEGFSKAPKDKQQSNVRDTLTFIKTVNGLTFKDFIRRPHFEKLTPIYPDERLKLETVPNEISTRIIDLISPIGKGQRGLVVSPPKAGKTVLLKSIANAISANYPDVCLIVLLIDERPEEVTDISESVNGMVIASCFDEMPERHVKVSELTLQYAERLVESGKDVVILMDSVTRLARAYNMTINPTGRSLSGGLDPGALYGPKKFFGAARNIREGGSLTIVATALVDTGSRLDDVIYEEFKGTGNMELHLDRNLSEKRIFPAIDIKKSGTRREDLLLNKEELECIYNIRRTMSNYSNDDQASSFIGMINKYKTNETVIEQVNIKLRENNK